MTLAVAAALAAAFCVALSTTMHQRAAKRQPPRRALDRRLLLRLVRTRLWQLGWPGDAGPRALPPGVTPACGRRRPV